MLRDSKLHFDRLSPTTRALTVGIMVLSGLLVAGLRGPAGPQPALAEDTPATKNGSSQSAGKMKLLSYVGESGSDKMSFADSGFAVQFERPPDLKSIKAVKVFGSRYGMPKPPDE